MPETVGYIVKDERLNLDIAILDIDSLHLHEETIPEMLEQLTHSIETDCCLRHPIIVDKQSLIVLDGVHRVVALRNLGVKRAPVCLVDYKNPNVKVGRWYRSINRAKSTQQIIDSVKQAGYAAKNVHGCEDELIGLSPTVAVLRIADKMYLINAPFKSLKEAYNIIGHIEQHMKFLNLNIKYDTEKDALRNLKEKRVDAVLCTPKISKEEIINAALSKQAFAWKATRHIIPARPMAINVPLSLLRDQTKSLVEVNRELKEMLQKRRLKRLLPGSLLDGRRYEEELYVFEQQVLAVNVNIRLLGVFRGLCGKDRLSLQLEQATVSNAIQILAASFPKDAKQLLIDPELNDPRPNALILLNGKEISALNGLETRIKNGDELTLIPIAHGG